MKLKLAFISPVALIASFAAAAASASSDAFVPPAIPLPTFNAKNVFDVKHFGATGDGETNDTRAINEAIAHCDAASGGTVKFPAGTYLVASVHLKSNVQLLLDDAATITGAKTGYDEPEPNPYDKFQDFGHSHFHNAVMWGENLENFAIVGGRINGGGTTQSDKVPPGGGDKVIAVRVGKNILFKNITHETGGHFVYLLNDCENVIINHVVSKKSRDTVDLMGCRNVAVSQCNFTGGSDDTLGIKSDYALGRKILTENIYAWDNYFESGCNGLQFGSETAGDFRNIYLWNIKIGQAYKAGIGITSNDGGVIENVHYKDITIKGAANPIFMLITKRLRTGEKNAKPGKIRDIHITNVTATDVIAGKHHGPANASTISGVPESAIENVTLENVHITYKGGSDPKEAGIVPPYPKDYSPNSMGRRPASGFFIRNAKDVVFRNVKIDFETADPKPPFVAFDVDGWELDHVQVETDAGVSPLRQERVTNLRLKDSPSLKPD